MAERQSLETTQVLSIIDWVLTVSAVAVLLAFWWRSRRHQKCVTQQIAPISPSTIASEDIQDDTLDPISPIRESLLHPQNTLKEDAILLGVIGYVAGAALLSVVGTQIWGQGGGIPVSILTGSGSQIIGAVVCIGLASSRFDGGVKSFLLGTGRSSILDQMRVTLLAVVCAWGLCPAVLELTVLAIKLVAPSFELPDHPTINALASDDQSSLLIVSLWIGAAVVAPVAEEIFFRGFIQTLLRNLLRNRSAAILGASIIFAGIHFPQQPHAIPALMVLAIILGYTYERTGSLVPAILVHGLFNLKTLIWHHIGSMPS